MPTSKPAHVPIRIPRSMVDRIDALRDPAVMSREAFVRMLLDRAITAAERERENR